MQHVARACIEPAVNAQILWVANFISGDISHILMHGIQVCLHYARNCAVELARAYLQNSYAWMGELMACSSV